MIGLLAVVALAGLVSVLLGIRGLPRRAQSRTLRALLRLVLVAVGLWILLGVVAVLVTPLV
ncbi:MAG: hypothetical protein ACRDHY_12965 [Anaerolineales bacterium]